MPPEIKTLVTTWVCNWCGRGTSHTHGTGAPQLPAEYFAGIGWVVIGPENIACDRCKQTPDVASEILAAAAKEARRAP